MSSRVSTFPVQLIKSLLAKKPAQTPKTTTFDVEKLETKLGVELRALEERAGISQEVHRVLAMAPLHLSTPVANDTVHGSNDVAARLACIGELGCLSGRLIKN